MQPRAMPAMNPPVNPPMPRCAPHARANAHAAPTHAEILALRTALVAALRGLNGDLRLRRTPEGLLELKLRCDHTPRPRGTLLRLGSAEDLLTWAHQHGRPPRPSEPDARLPALPDPPAFPGEGLATLDT